MAWWDIYFDEWYLRMFEATLSAERTAQEVTGVISLLDLEAGARILDLCCGQGRHALPLAQAGYEVTGLDRSTFLLKEARRAAADAQTVVHWVRGDMRWLPWRGAFDACINLFTAFGYFDEEAQNQQVLQQVYNALRPGGVFLLDLSNRDYHLLRMWPRTWHRQGKAFVLEENEFDPRTCRFYVTFTWVEGEKVHSLSHSVRSYTAPELLGMLHAAGLVATNVCGDFDGSEFSLDSKRLIVVAQKPQEVSNERR
jgi:SAM-dependent methyltransferase